jgi:hypothetical protein
MFTGFTKVSIPNFKSLRDLEFSPRRVNLFIGEANTGKSNILEALAVFSEGLYDDDQTFKDVLRFKTVADLFYDHDLSQTARVAADGVDWSLKREGAQYTATYLGPPGKDGVKVIVTPPGQINQQNPWAVGLSSVVGLAAPSPGEVQESTSVSNPFLRGLTHPPQGPVQGADRPVPRTRFYRFRQLANFTNMQVDTLHAPYGANLAVLLETNKRLFQLADDMFRAQGFRLLINMDTYELSMLKEQQGRLIPFSYPTISETFRRIVFFLAILETNRNAVLIFDEPEANIYSLYATYLAERIALDETNQFFLSTHNPYILGSIVGKTPIKDLAVFVTTMEGFRSNLKQVADDKLPLILDYGQSAFMNLEKLVEE